MQSRYVPFSSQLDQELFVLFWIVCAIQNFLFYTVAATLVVDFVVFVEHPVLLLESIARSISAGATFYIIYIETQVLMALVLPGMFRSTYMTNTALHVACCGCVLPLRRMAYSFFLCGSCGSPSTPSAWTPSSPLTSVLFVFLVINAYAVIQPVVSVVGLIYMFVALVMYVCVLAWCGASSMSVDWRRALNAARCSCSTAFASTWLRVTPPFLPRVTTGSADRNRGAIILPAGTRTTWCQ